MDNNWVNQFQGFTGNEGYYAHNDGSVFGSPLPSAFANADGSTPPAESGGSCSEYMGQYYSWYNLYNAAFPPVGKGTNPSGISRAVMVENIRKYATLAENNKCASHKLPVPSSHGSFTGEFNEFTGGMSNILPENVWGVGKKAQSWDKPQRLYSNADGDNPYSGLSCAELWALYTGMQTKINTAKANGTSPNLIYTMTTDLQTVYDAMMMKDCPQLSGIGTGSGGMGGGTVTSHTGTATAGGGGTTSGGGSTTMGGGTVTSHTGTPTSGSGIGGIITHAQDTIGGFISGIAHTLGGGKPVTPPAVGTTNTGSTRNTGVAGGGSSTGHRPTFLSWLFGKHIYKNGAQEENNIR